MPAGRADHAPAFAALGDATRLAIVSKLAKGAGQSITELTEGASVTRQAITKHLRVLQGAGLVRSERIGREVVFQLEPVGCSARAARGARRALSLQVKLGPRVHDFVINAG